VCSSDLTQDNTNEMNVHRHQCLGWDSNSRSHGSSGPSQFHALDPAATVIDWTFISRRKKSTRLLTFSDNEAGRVVEASGTLEHAPLAD
jgi:hypothetical protein